MYLKYALTVISKVFLEIYSNLRANTSREKIHEYVFTLRYNKNIPFS